MSSNNEIIARFHGERFLVTKQKKHQYDYGQKLVISGLTLPSTFQVHFANSLDGNSITQMGNSNGVVNVPNQCFQSGEDIYAWIYLHSTASDGETQYTIRVPILKRAKPSDETPTPAQQSALDEAVAAMSGVVEAAQAARDAAQTAQSGAETAAANAATSEGNASNSASAAATSATNAARSEANASTYKDNASASATAAAASESNASTSATQASQSASSAHTSEGNAASSAQAAAASATASEASALRAEAAETTVAASASDAASSAAAAHASESSVAANAAAAQEALASSRQISTQVQQGVNDAAASATAAASSATAAATSASEASGSATAASTSATAASQSATGAAGSATDAAASASAAAASAASIGESETNAAASAQAAAASETNAASSASAAVQSAADAASAAQQAAEETFQQLLDRVPADYADLIVNVNELKQDKKLLEQMITGRTGKVWKRKVWKYAVNTTTACPAMDEYNDGTATPFTDTVYGSDPYMDNYEVFRWQHCNYVREDDGTAIPTALEGYANYQTTGAVDIGTLLPTFWWNWEEFDEYYVLSFSDTPHPELGLVPWRDAVKADGTVLPFFVVSSYPSVIASDTKLRSQHGRPANSQSYNNIITNYRKKGDGYWGAGSSICTLAMIYLIVKYNTKSIQAVMSGCSSFYTSTPVALAEENVTRVLVAANVTNYSVHDWIGVGTAEHGNWTNSTLVRYAEITSIETVEIDGTSYLALNLDVETPFTTTTPMYVCGNPCPSGQTDKVIGHYDGSFLSNTNSKHSCRIEGIELLNGNWFVFSDTVIEFENGVWNVYVAEKGTAHVSGNRTGYKLIGTSDAFTADRWVGNVDFDLATGAFYHKEVGGGNAVGCGDYHYHGGADVADGTKREWRGWGHLYYGSIVGLVCGDGGYALSYADASFGSRD